MPGRSYSPFEYHQPTFDSPAEQADPPKTLQHPLLDRYLIVRNTNCIPEKQALACESIPVTFKDLKQEAIAVVATLYQLRLEKTKINYLFNM